MFYKIDFTKGIGQEAEIEEVGFKELQETLTWCKFFFVNELKVLSLKLLLNIVFVLTHLPRKILLYYVVEQIEIYCYIAQD